MIVGKLRRGSQREKLKHERVEHDNSTRSGLAAVECVKYCSLIVQVEETGLSIVRTGRMQLWWKVTK
jgi:hypothetical protein